MIFSAAFACYKAMIADRTIAYSVENRSACGGGRAATLQITRNYARVRKLYLFI